MLSYLPRAIGGIVALRVQAARPTIAAELLDPPALILRPRLVRLELCDRPQVVAAQLLYGGLQHAPQESVRFGPEVSLLARGPGDDAGATGVTDHDPMRRII